MAAFDIIPLHSSGGFAPAVRWGQMTASEVFDTGEPVSVVDAGTLTEPTDDDAQYTVAQMDGGTEAGIAAFGPAGGAQTNDRAARINPMTGVAFASLDDIAYYPFNEGTIFKFRSMWAAADSASAARSKRYSAA